MSMRRRLPVLVVAAALVMSPWLRAQRASAVLLFDIGIHVEPFGLSSGRITTGPGTYADEDYFRRHAAYLRSLADVAERHGGRLTIQVQSPFIDYAPHYDNVIGELAARGHEIAFHMHEDAHLGRSADTLGADRWISAINAQIEKIKALGVERVRMWSGGNLYPHMLEVAAATGLDVKADWKDPRTQSTDVLLMTTAPWRPAASPDGTDVTLFARHDPNGALIFLPAGIIDPFGLVSEEIYGSTEPAAALQDYWTEGLSGSLSSSAQSPASTHTFHITLHPGELQQHGLGGDTTLDAWLSSNVDPLVQSGRVRWATFSQMADLYAANGK